MVLPNLSVAVHVMMVSPSGKVAGASFCTCGIESTISVAVAVPMLTVFESAVASMMISSGRTSCGDGEDIIFGNEGEDSLSGNNGNDIIKGGSGNDNLHGNEGTDIIDGGDDHDTCNIGELPSDDLIIKCEAGQL